MGNDRLHTMKQKALQTTKRLLAIALYLWVLLTLFALHKALLLHETDVLYHVGFALLNALALAKVIFIGQELGLGERLKNKPLIYPILFKSFVFAVLLFVFRIVEEIVIGLMHHKSVGESLSQNPALGTSPISTIFIVCLTMFVALLPFFTWLEMIGALGAEEMLGLLFGPKHKDSAAPAAEAPVPAQVAQPAQAAGQGYWYFEKSRSVLGPFSHQEMAQKRASGELLETTLVYNAELGIEWRALGDIDR